MNVEEFYFEVKNETPLILKRKRKPIPNDLRFSYWALSCDAFGPFTPILVHIYCHGPLPDDDRRVTINEAIKRYVRRILTMP